MDYKKMPANGEKDKLMKTWAELEWVWILINPITRHRDSIMVIETEEPGGAKRVVPIFENRENAQAIKPRLTQGREDEYEEQAISLGELGKFAARENLEIVLLDGEGRILARLSAEMEEGPLH